MAKLEQQMLHDFAMNKIFTPENAKTATEQADKMLAEPSPFAKGEKVRLAHSLKRPEENDDHEIIGFYSNGEIIDENTASPYNNTYGVRVRNLKTGKEYPVIANDLKRIAEKKQFQPTKETIWNDPKHPLYGIGPSEQNPEFLKSAIAEITRNTQSPAHFKFYAGNSGGTMAQAKKQLAQYKKALDYIENYGRK